MERNKRMKFSDAGQRSAKVIPDYVGDRYWAGVLAKRVENFWHKQGYHKIKAWVETTTHTEGNKTYSVRSNIVFDCNDLTQILHQD